jgi:hypothetical protein
VLSGALNEEELREYYSSDVLGWYSRLFGCHRISSLSFISPPGAHNWIKIANFSAFSNLAIPAYFALTLTYAVFHSRSQLRDLYSRTE